MNTVLDPLPTPAMLGRDVGAGRWPKPLHAGYEPWRGTVLAWNDPQAWVGMPEFPDETTLPSQESVDAHVAELIATGPQPDRVPVLWHFDSGPTIHWMFIGDLLPYEEDLRQWRAAHAEARHLVTTSESPYIRGRAAGIAGEPEPEQTDLESVEDRTFALGWRAGADMRAALDRPAPSRAALVPHIGPLIDLDADKVRAAASLPSIAIPKVGIRPMHPPPTGSPYQPFYEHVAQGGSVWRADDGNSIREWINLKTLGGDAARVQLYGLRTLAYAVDAKETAYRLRLADDIENLADACQRKGYGMLSSDLEPARRLAASNFEFGVRLAQLSAGIRRPGHAGFEARKACARHIFAHGMMEAALRFEFAAAFDFSGHDLQDMFDGPDGPRLKEALIADANAFPGGPIAASVKACTWLRGDTADAQAPTPMSLDSNFDALLDEVSRTSQDMQNHIGGQAA